MQLLSPSKQSSLIVTAALLIGGVLIAGPASAQTVYTSQATFTAATTGVSTETFDSFPTSSAPVTANGVTVSDPRGLSGVFVGPATYGSGKSVQLSTGSPAGSIVTFSAASSVTAFGINVYDLGTIGATTLGFTLSNGHSGTFVSNYTGAGGNMLFVGVTDTTAFNSITFSNSVAGDFIELDNLRHGTAIRVAAVPEPSEYAVGGMFGATMLFGMVKARRKVGTTHKTVAA